MFRNPAPASPPHTAGHAGGTGPSPSRPSGGFQPGLFGDAPLPAHNHTPTSRRAADRVREQAGPRRQAVLEAVRGSRAGLTRDEIAERLWLPVHAICPRVTELVKFGQLVETKNTRPTRAGCPAVVLIDSARFRR